MQCHLGCLHFYRECLLKFSIQGHFCAAVRTEYLQPFLSFSPLCTQFPTLCRTQAPRLHMSSRWQWWSWWRSWRRGPYPQKASSTPTWAKWVIPPAWERCCGALLQWGLSTSIPAHLLRTGNAGDYNLSVRRVACGQISRTEIQGRKLFQQEVYSKVWIMNAGGLRRLNFQLEYSI